MLIMKTIERELKERSLRKERACRKLQHLLRRHHLHLYSNDKDNFD